MMNQHSQCASRHAPLIFAIGVCCLILTANTLSVNAAWRSVGNVQSVERTPTAAQITLTSGARLSISFVTPDVVRVRLNPRGEFGADASYAVEEKRRASVPALMGLKSGEMNEAIEVASERMRVRVKLQPMLITIYDSQGRIVCEDDPARPVMYDPDTGAFETSKRRAETEVYYGFGEKALPMSRHNQTMVMWNTDTFAYPPGLDPIYQSIGFFTALHQGRAYGVFLDNTYRAHFDMGHTAPGRYTFGAQGGELNYYVFTGGAERSPKQILADYTDLTGRAPLPPTWALGYQQSRWSYYPESRVRELAARFRRERVPADVLYLDIDYMDGFRVFTWDKTRFPAPAKMLADLKSQGFSTVIIIDPGIKVDPNYSVYTEGQKGNHFHKDASGKEFNASVWPGVCAFPDFTSPEARAWFGSLYKQHLDEGVAGFWNDMNEPATFLPDELDEPRIFHHPGKTFPLDVPHAGDGQPDTHARYHNVYGMQMARATYEGLKKLRPNERPFVLTRAGYAGVQRYSAVWTGDNATSWDHLALTVPMLTNLGVSGVPLVGADVGGFGGNPSPELYTRWMQAAALTPLMRSHVEKQHPDREPWMHGEPYTSINRKAIELRYQLLPHLVALFEEHARTGAPVMRPMWFDYSADTRTLLIEDQFMVGRELLVAPVVRESQKKRRVYFPKGDAWVDFYTGRRYEGGTEAEVDAPLDRLPLFARVNATIAVQPIVQHTGEMKASAIKRIVIGERATTFPLAR